MTLPKLLIVATVAETLDAFLLPFAQHFRRQGWQVDALAEGANRSQACRDSFDQVWDIHWSRNPFDPRNLLSAAPALRDRVRQGRYDLVHVHTPVAAFVTRWALRDLRRQGQVKVVYTAHGFHFHPEGNPLKNWMFRRLETWAGRWTDHLITINRQDYQAAYEAGLVKSALGQGHRLSYMPGIGVDLNHYSTQAVQAGDIAELYEELGLATSTPLVLCAAEFIPRKRHADLLQAFARRAQDHEAHLLLAGDGPLRPAMEALAQALQIQARVHFLGNRQDIPRLLTAARVTLLASQQEGLPRCILESLAVGTPVIGTQIRGTADLLAPGGGLLVPLGDRQALANALVELLQHPARAVALGQQGRAQIQAYDLASVIALHDRLYQSLLQPAEARPALPLLKSLGETLALALKASCDRAAAAAAILLLSPIMAAVALAIALTMGGPVLFAQQRPGKDGRIFELYKFRTMVPGRDDEADGHRITPLGDWLRRLSLDELPQLFNVLRGEMSLVGPRPLMVRYLPRYSEAQARRHCVKPGITGLAQVNGRNSISWDEKFRWDLDYIDRWSLGLDLKILYFTVLRVLGRSDINQAGDGAVTMPDFLGMMQPSAIAKS